VDPIQGEPIVKKPVSAAKNNKTPKSKAKSLIVKTNVKAGRGPGGQRCEILRRKV
jgi:hypothetical protein